MARRGRRPRLRPLRRKQRRRHRNGLHHGARRVLKWLHVAILPKGGRAVAFRAMRLDYHKLVRDGIPRIIEAGGGQPVTRVLDQAGYTVALRVKLMEEAEEAHAAPDRLLRSELADVLEVLRALA